MQGREQMFYKILLFFAVFTAITGFFNMAGNGTITLGSLGSDYVPGQVIPNNQISGYVEGTNTATGTQVTGIFLNNATSVNSNITTEIGGPWTLISGSGLVLTGLPLLPGTLNPSAVIVRNGQSVNGIYSTSATIKNPSSSDFYVFPRFIDGYSGSDLKVVFSSDGVHVKKFPLNYGFFDAGDDYFYPLDNAQITLGGGSTILTQLTETVSSQNSNNPDYTSLLNIYKDGVPIVSALPVRSILPGANINDQVRHGGAGSDTAGFIVMSFPNTNALDTSQTIISGSTGSALDPIGAILAFLNQIGTIVGLTPNPVVPFWLWAIVAIPLIATLYMIYIEIARGV